MSGPRQCLVTCSCPHLAHQYRAPTCEKELGERFDWQISGTMFATKPNIESMKAKKTYIRPEVTKTAIDREASLVMGSPDPLVSASLAGLLKWLK